MEGSGLQRLVVLGGVGEDGADINFVRLPLEEGGLELRESLERLHPNIVSLAVDVVARGFIKALSRAVFRSLTHLVPNVNLISGGGAECKRPLTLAPVRRCRW